MTDPYGNFKFRIADGTLMAKAKQGRSVFERLPPSAVERLAGLDDAEIRERNRRLNEVNGDLEAWRRTVEGTGAPTLTGELIIRDADGKVEFRGRASLLDIKPNYDDLPPGVEMVEVGT